MAFKDDVIKARIEVEGASRANQEILLLSKSIDDLKKSNSSLKDEQTKLVAVGKKESDEYRNLTKAIQSNNAEIKTLTTRKKEVNGQISYSIMSYSQLKTRAVQLRRELNNVSKELDPDRWKSLNAELGNVNKQMEKVKVGTGNTSNVFSGAFKQMFLSVSLGHIASNVFSKISSTLDQSVDKYAEFDDKLADVMKTTGLTKDEVEDLNLELKKIDTRSSQMELLNLARIAGKLGIDSAKDVEGFVRAADKINVALGEDLGGNAEDVVNQIGKLVDIFGLKTEYGLEDSMIRIGSAINEAGAASTANEGYIVEFAKRVAGVAPSAGISIQSIIGLGATLDQFGQQSEVSSTAYTQAITGMFKKTEIYAQIAGVSLQDFTTLMNTDANAAFITFLRGLDGNNVGMAELTTNLDSLGMDGTRATTVLGTLAENVEILEQQQALANKAFSDGTSVLNEYGIKNDTAAAQVAKKKKAIEDITVSIGQRLLPIYSQSIGVVGNFMKVIKVVVDVLFDNRSIILSLITGIGSYIIITKTLIAIKSIYNTILIKNNADTLTAIIITKAKTMADNIASAAVALHSAAVSLFSGNIKGAAQAMRVFNAVLKTTPLGWAAAGIGLIVGAITLLTNKSNTLIKTQQALTDINVQAANSIAKEKVNLSELLRVASDRNESDLNRKNAIEELQKIIPDGINLITEETIATGKAKIAVDEYCESMLRQSKITAARQKLEEIEKDRLQGIADGSAGALKFGQSIVANSLDLVGFYDKSVEYVASRTTKNIKKFNSDAKTMSDAVIEEMGKIQKEAAKTQNSITQDPKSNGGSNTKNKPTDLQRQREAEATARREAIKQSLALTEQEKINHDERLKKAGITEAEITRIKQKNIATLTTLEADKLNAYNALNEQYLKSLEKITEKEREFRNNIITESLDDYKKEEVAHQKRIKQSGITEEEITAIKSKSAEEQTNLERQKLQVWEILNKQYQTNIEKIETDAIHKWDKKQQEQFANDVTKRKIGYNNEIASVTTLEQAKQVLRDKYGVTDLAKIKTLADAKKAIREQQQQKEEVETVQYYEGLSEKIQKLLFGIDMEGFNLADMILTSEQETELLAMLDKLGLKISDIKAKTTEGENEKSERGKGGSSDVLGMSADDWEKLFENLDEGDNRMQAILGVMNAFSDTFKQIDSLMTASENARFKQFETNNNKQKQKLQERLNSGLISQETYNRKVEALDQELESRRAELELKQAKRSKAIAIFDAITNTAVAVTSALSIKPLIPLGLIMASLVGAMGAAQIGMIAAQPLPGREKGGMLVQRAQDGRNFNAEFEPNRRGFVNRPTVIVGENGREYVLPAEAMDNPTLTPFIQMIEQQRLRGNLRTANFNNVIPQSVVGRASGGTVSESSIESGEINTSIQSTNQLFSMLYTAINNLLERLKHPLAAEVKLLGKGGLEDKQRELKTIRDKASI